MPTITSSDRITSPSTISRTKVLRRRSVISAVSSLLVGRQHEQQPAIIVIGGKHVRLRARGDVALAGDLDRLVERPHPPLEHGRDRVVAILEAQPEHLLHALAD